MIRKIIFKFLWIPALLFWATPSMAAIYTGGFGEGYGYAQGNSGMYYGGNGEGYGVIAMVSDTDVGYNVTATQLTFTTSPSNSYAGAAFGTQPIVAVEDTYGNTVLSATNNVTLSINNDPVGSSTLGGTTSMAAVAGVANFSGDGVYVSRAGTPYALQAAASGLSSATSSTFSSSSPVQISYPTGGQVLTVSTAYNITWNTYGSLATGANTVQYSLNNGSTWVTLSTSATSPLSWVTPSTPSTQALVRVSNSADSTFTNTSASTFSVLAGFTMISPGSSSVWANGFAHTISWSTQGTVANVKLEYSANGGSTWTTITSSTANTNSYSWTPSVSSGGTNYVIRVSDASDSLSNAVSSAFTIQAVAVTAPTSGQRIEAGTSTNITWTSAGISNVEIQYTTNGGSSWTTITSSVSAAGGSYSWSVPSGFTTSTNVQVSISSTAVDSDSDTATVTSSAFTIYGALSITVPNASGIQWAASTAQTITWSTTAGTITNVKLQYSADNFVSDFHTIVASTSNSGSYSWTPTVTGATFKVRVSDAQDSQDYSTSANYFSVTGIGVTSPAAGATWACSSSQSIVWNYTGSFTNVNIQYSTNNGSTWTTIASSAPNTGSYSWTSVENTPSSTALISVTDSANSLITGNSGVFNIQSVLGLTYPSGGQTLNVGSPYNITWTTTGTVSNVELQYSTNNGSTWNTIAASTSNTGSYSWTVPNAISTQALVKVSDADAGHPASSAQSASEFTIQSNIAVTSPTTSNNWAVNETHNITWTNTGTVGQVQIYYATSANSYATWTQITSGAISNTNSYSWTLPDLLLAVGQNPQTNPSLAVEVEVVDASSSHPATTAISNVFDVIYYTTTWVVEDSQTHSLLSGLSVSDTSGWSASSLSSGVTHNYPYGTYTTIWSQANYVNASDVNWVANQNQTQTVSMELTSLAGSAYDVYSNFTYDATSNAYLVNSWIQQAGVDVTSPTSCTVTILDSNDNVVSTLSSSSPDSNGIFRSTWSLSGLNTNTTYLGKVQIVYNGNTYSANTVYSISVPTITALSAQLTGVGTNVSTIQTSVGSNLGTNVSAIETSVGSNLGTNVSALQTTANNISTAVGTLQTTENNVLTSVGSNLTGQLSGVDSDLTNVVLNPLVSDITTVGGNVTTLNNLTKAGGAGDLAAILSNASTAATQASNAATQATSAASSASTAATQATNAATTSTNLYNILKANGAGDAAAILTTVNTLNNLTKSGGLGDLAAILTNAANAASSASTAATQATNGAASAATAATQATTAATQATTAATMSTNLNTLLQANGAGDAAAILTTVNTLNNLTKSGGLGDLAAVLTNASTAATQATNAATTSTNLYNILKANGAGDAAAILTTVNTLNNLTKSGGAGDLAAVLSNASTAATQATSAASSASTAATQATSAATTSTNLYNILKANGAGDAAAILTTVTTLNNLTQAGGGGDLAAILANASNAATQASNAATQATSAASSASTAATQATNAATTSTNLYNILKANGAGDAAAILTTVNTLNNLTKSGGLGDLAAILTNAANAASSASTAATQATNGAASAATAATQATTAATQATTAATMSTNLNTLLQANGAGDAAAILTTVNTLNNLTKSGGLGDLAAVLTNASTAATQATNAATTSTNLYNILKANGAGDAAAILTTVNTLNNLTKSGGAGDLAAVLSNASTAATQATSAASSASTAATQATSAATTSTNLYNILKANGAGDAAAILTTVTTLNNLTQAGGGGDLAAILANASNAATQASNAATQATSAASSASTAATQATNAATTSTNLYNILKANGAGDAAAILTTVNTLNNLTKSGGAGDLAAVLSNASTAATQATSAASSASTAATQATSAATTSTNLYNILKANGAGDAAAILTTVTTLNNLTKAGGAGDLAAILTNASNAATGVSTVQTTANNISTSVGSNLTGQVASIASTLSSLSTLTTTINSLLPQLNNLTTTVTTINTLLGSASNPNSLYGKLATINTNVNTLINDWGTYKASDIVNNANTVAAALGNPVDSCGLLTVFGKINCIYNQGGDIESTSALANQTYNSIQQLQQQIGSKGKSVEAYHLMQKIGVYSNGLETSVGVIPQNTVQPELFQISQNVQAAQRTLAKTSSQAGITSVVPSQGTQVSPVTLDNLHQELLELKQMTELVKNTVVSKEGPQVKAYFENGSTGK